MAEIFVWAFIAGFSLALFMLPLVLMSIFFVWLGNKVEKGKR